MSIKVITSNYSRASLYFSKICKDRYPNINSILSQKGDKRSLLKLSDSIKFLKELDRNPDPNFQKIKSKLRVGTISTSDIYGDTSMEMAYAFEHFEKNKYSGDHVSLVTFESNIIQYSHYTLDKNTNIVYCKDKYPCFYAPSLREVFGKTRKDLPKTCLEEFSNNMIYILELFLKKQMLNKSTPIYFIVKDDIFDKTPFCSITFNKNTSKKININYQRSKLIEEKQYLEDTIAKTQIVRFFEGMIINFPGYNGVTFLDQSSQIVYHIMSTNIFYANLIAQNKIESNSKLIAVLGNVKDRPYLHLGNFFDEKFFTFIPLNSHGGECDFTLIMEEMKKGDLWKKFIESISKIDNPIIGLDHEVTQVLDSNNINN